MWIRSSDELALAMTGSSAIDPSELSVVDAELPMFAMHAAQGSVRCLSQWPLLLAQHW